MTIKLDALSSFDKTLLDRAFDHYIKNIRPVIIGADKSAEASDKRLVGSIMTKLESNNYELTSEELSAFYSVLGYFQSDLITGAITPYDDESEIDYAHNSIKDISRTIESLLEN